VRTHRIAAVALLLAVACATFHVESDWDPEADFSTLRTWDWLDQAEQEPGHPLLRSPLLHERIRRAVEDELVRRGHPKATGGRPDFRVGYHLSLEQKLDVYTIDRTYGYGRFGAWTYPETHVNEYQEGTLILDVVDARRGKLAWRGWASRPVYEQPSPEESERNAREAVAAILEKFPPPPGERR
jgi:hypothetical protein